MDIQRIQDILRGTLPALIGMKVIEATRERVVAEVAIRDDLRTFGGAVHGGTLMALADTTGAIGAFLNLPEGASTATIESKTNFFAAGREGTLHAESTALHIGRRTMTWQTRITDDAGRLLSFTVQTQAVLEGR